MRLLALCVAAVSAIKLGYPRDEGFSRAGERSLEDDDGELDTREVTDMSDEADTNHYKGEDEHREQINEQVTHWKQERNHPVIVRSKTAIHYRNDDLW